MSTSRLEPDLERQRAARRATAINTYTPTKSTATISSGIKTALKNSNIAKSNISKAREAIDKLSKGPSKYMIVDPNTGVKRRAVGNDIDYLKNIIKDNEGYLNKSEQYLRTVSEYYKSGKTVKPSTITAAKYRVTIKSGDNKSVTKTFNTKKEAETYVSRIKSSMKMPLRGAKLDVTEVRTSPQLTTTAKRVEVSKLLKPLFTKIQSQSDEYYKGSGLSRTVKPEKGDIKTYYELTGYKAVNPPKNVSEIKNRLAYMGSNMALGALREVTLPASLTVGQPRNYEEAILQMTGGIITPSPADYAVGMVLQRLSLTKRGRKLLDDLASALKRKDKKAIEEIREAIMFEKMYAGGITDARRNAPSPTKMRRAIEEIMEEYSKKTAGAAVIPEELIELNQLAPDYFDDAYIDFLNDGSAIIDINNPFAAYAISSKLDAETKNMLAQKEIQSLTELYKEITTQSEAQLEKTFDETIMNVTETSIPDISLAQDELQTQVEEEDLELIVTPIEETTIEEEETPQETLTIRLSKKDQDKRQKINLQLYRGAVKIYKVKYDRGGTVGPLEARSLIDALSVAQRKRLSTKKRPTDIIVELVGERR